MHTPVHYGHRKAENNHSDVTQPWVAMHHNCLVKCLGFRNRTFPDWLIESGLTSHQTHYRSYRGTQCKKQYANISIYLQSWQTHPFRLELGEHGARWYGQRRLDIFCSALCRRNSWYCHPGLAWRRHDVIKVPVTSPSAAGVWVDDRDGRLCVNNKAGAADT